MQIRQSQTPALTPKLVQSIALLQMDAAEIHDFVREEVEKNPLLEFNDESIASPEKQSVQKNPKAHIESSEKIFSNLFLDRNINNPEFYITEQQCLKDFLIQQAGITFHSNRQLQIAQYIIDLIDDDGYLREDLNSICKQFNTDMSAILNIFRKIHEFDPPGVGARNLTECMRLQLERKNRLDPTIQVLTENLALLARKDYDALAKLCNVNHEILIEMTLEIRKLNPRPGNIFDSAPITTITPDIFVNSLDRRAQVILRVATEITRRQNIFFVEGEEFLKPLTLKSVAKKIGAHESTVNRMTRDKYLACNHGIFAFKYFFMSGVKTGNNHYGSQSIRRKIHHIIVSENKNNMLSDEKIAKLLYKEDIAISRRTVTKYREVMGFLSSTQRRREISAFARHPANSYKTLSKRS